MTKAEALQVMREGHRVTHRYFQPHEWMMIKDNMIIFEDGTTITIEEFYNIRNQDSWENEYSLFEDSNDFPMEVGITDIETDII